MTRFARVHTEKVFPTGEKLEVGEVYRVIDEPQDFDDILLLMAISEKGDEGKVIPLDFGEGFGVMTIEPDEDGICFSTHFEFEEEN